jgi:hypothetical protein
MVVAFHNPSVRDFLERYLADNAEIVHALCSSAVFYEQIMTLCGTRPGKAEREQIVAIAHRAPQVLAEAIARSVGHSLRQKRLLRLSTGTFISRSVVETTLEVKVAHALTIADHLPTTYKVPLSKQLVDTVTARVSAGTAVMGEVHKTIAAAQHVEDAELNTEMLIAATVGCFESTTRQYEQLVDIIALHKFAQCAPRAIKPDLTARVKARLEKDADGIFDNAITEADDEYDIDHLREIVWGFEKTFDVDLSPITDRLEEKLEEISGSVSEQHEDRFERKESAQVDATDADIVAMFAALTE